MVAQIGDKVEGKVTKGSPSGSSETIPADCYVIARPKGRTYINL
jgi:hypothetical protein